MLIHRCMPSEERGSNLGLHIQDFQTGFGMLQSNSRRWEPSPTLHSTALSMVVVLTCACKSAFSLCSRKRSARKRPFSDRSVLTSFWKHRAEARSGLYHIAKYRYPMHPSRRRAWAEYLRVHTQRALYAHPIERHSHLHSSSPAMKNACASLLNAPSGMTVFSPASADLAQLSTGSNTHFQGPPPHIRIWSVFLFSSSILKLQHHHRRM
jgi:hypothetical protein